MALPYTVNPIQQNNNNKKDKIDKTHPGINYPYMDDPHTDNCTQINIYK